MGRNTFHLSLSEIRSFSLRERLQKPASHSPLQWAGKLSCSYSQVTENIPKELSWIPNFSQCDNWGLTSEIFHWGGSNAVTSFFFQSALCFSVNHSLTASQCLQLLRKKQYAKSYYSVIMRDRRSLLWDLFLALCQWVLARPSAGPITQ